MKTRTSRWFALVVGSAVFAGGIALAADPAPNAPADPSAEQRHTMAEIHQKMADCLNSEKPFADCRAEMQANCLQMMGTAGCPMMGMMGGGMMQGQGMMGGRPPAQSNK